MLTTPCDSYSVPTFISILNLKIFNIDHALLTNSKKFNIILSSHKSRMALQSKILLFKDL